MASQDEHEVVSSVLALKDQAARLPSSSAADDLRSGVAALIVLLARIGYTFPRSA
jgi:hypothetical protein